MLGNLIELTLWAMSLDHPILSISAVIEIEDWDRKRRLFHFYIEDNFWTRRRALGSSNKILTAFFHLF